MLIIRKEQFETLNRSVFEDDLFNSVIKAWPEECQRLGDDGVIDWLRQSLERAELYGITKNNNKRRFVNLSFLLGRIDFDIAPETEWAATILGWESGGENLKMSALEKRAEVELDRLIDMEGNRDRDI